MFLATFLVFWPVRNHQFIFLDDPVYVTQNKVVSQGLTVAGLRWAFTDMRDDSNWFPLTRLSHMLDVQLFGLAPRGHHLMSAFIHALSAALLFLVLWSMTAAMGRSAAVAALFGLHPLRVESVAWVAERKDVLSGLFWMLTLLAYLRWARQPRPGRYLAAAAVFALGLMTKPMLVTLPFILLLLDFWPLGRLRPFARTNDGAATNGGVVANGGGVPFFRLLLEKTPFLALSAAASAITLIAQAGAIRVVQRQPFAARLGNAVHSYCAYLGKAVWPTDLMIFYPQSGSWLNPRAALAYGLLLAAITGTAVLAARSRPWLLTGWLWYVGTLVPVIGLVQVGSQAMADRYTYLPLIGVCIAVAWGLPDLFPQWRRRGMVLAALTAAVCVGLALLTIRQLGTMKNDESLYRHMLAVDPADQKTRHSLGITLINLGRVEEGLAQLRGVQYRLDHGRLFGAHMETAAQLFLEGKADEALLQYTWALRLDPGNPVALEAVVRLKAAGARVPAGAAASLTVRELIDDKEATFWIQEGTALATAGQYASAMDRYTRALQLKPDSADAWNNMGSCYGKLNRFPEAIDAYEKALAADPGHRAARQNLDEVRRYLGR